MKLKNRIKLVEDILGYEFRDKNLINQALTHSSCKTLNSKVKDNELLEYMGDAVLSMVITDILFREHPTQKEGVHTKLRSTITNNIVLAKTVETLGLQKTIKLGNGQKINANILSDLLEAIIGAIYLDGQFHNTYYVIKKIYENHWSGIAQENSDYKSQLQELTQKKFKSKPSYKLVQTEGPPHKKEFTVAVDVNNKIISIGKALTKKQAEQNAAKDALEKLFKIN